MVLVSLALWAGVPFAALWVASQVQGETASLGLALLAMVVVVAAGIVLLMRLLGWLNLRLIHARERRGLETYGNVTLEGIMAMCAGVALVSLCIWFFLFSGSSPVPFHISY
jgi:UPF0716 family protein affecting phage T7 exclusion